MAWEYMFYREPNPFKQGSGGFDGVKITRIEELNKLGQDGWEVVLKNDSSEWFLKREIRL
jgi:hypothetical protein